MYGTSDTRVMWCLGLEPGDVERIRACAGARLEIRAFAQDADFTAEAVDRDEPVLLWVGSGVWVRFAEGDPLLHVLGHLPRVLVLPLDSPKSELERALQGGFQDVLLGCELSERVHEVLNRSLEIANVTTDMGRMAREILMHRELLLRKSDVFGFLQGFVAAVSKAENPAEVLRGARTHFADLLPLVSMHVARWRMQGNEASDVTLFLDAREEGGLDLHSMSDEARGWADLLLGAAMSLVPFGGTPDPALVWYSEGQMRPVPHSRLDGLPDTRRTVLLPICVGGGLEGLVALHLKYDSPRGRDQVLAMDAAASHLGMALRVLEHTGQNSLGQSFAPRVLTGLAMQ